jgi:ADP-ribosylglycohydrolase
MGNATPKSKRQKVFDPRPLDSGFIGAFLGLGIGDYTGAVVEGNSPDECERKFSTVGLYLQESRDHLRGEEVLPKDVPALQPFLEILNGHFPFGQITDDTQLAREIGLSIVDLRGFDVDSCAARMAWLYKTHKMVGTGPATATALTKLIKGSPASESGGHGFGNSPVVRNLALGLLHCRLTSTDLDVLVECTISQSRITHTNSMCSEAALVFAVAIGLALAAGGKSEEFNADHFLVQLCGQVKQHVSDKMEGYLALLADCLPLSSNKAVLRLGTAGCDLAYAAAHKPDKYALCSPLTAWV